MFEIEYRGGNAVVITTKKSTIAIDPKRSSFGHEDITEKGAVELATESTFLTGSPNYQISLEGPGEYEVSDFAIKGIPACRHLDDPKTACLLSNIYTITIDDIKICVFGNTHADLAETQLDELGPVDILIIPVGGNGYTLDATSAASITRRVDPKVVIPVHYQDPALKYEVPQDSADLFVSELKAPVIEDRKFKLKSSTNLPESLEIHKISFIK